MYIHLIYYNISLILMYEGNYYNSCSTPSTNLETLILGFGNFLSASFNLQSMISGLSSLESLS